MSIEHRRLGYALLISLLVHALLLGLTFGGQGLGLPGFGFPWQERRIEAPDLSVVIEPAPSATPPPAVVPVPAPVTVNEAAPMPGSTVEPAVSPAPTPDPSTELTVPESPPPARTEPQPEPTMAEAPAEASLALESPGGAAPTRSVEPLVSRIERLDRSAWAIAPVPSVPTPVLPVAPSASSPTAAMTAPRSPAELAREPIDTRAREQAAEMTRLEQAVREARRQAEQLEAARIEDARREAERVVAERQEAPRQEAARQDAQRAETARQETARQEAARQEAARQEAAAKADAARLEAAREAAARREAALQAIGRQLNEEAAKREAASNAVNSLPRPAPSSSPVRRARLFGRADSNAELILYAEAWARKIQLNMTFDMIREVVKRPHTQPLVTVAIRSDGSVESVTFVLSSGVAEIDEAIRRIVQSQAPYAAFPPALANDYDVIEIRRTWHFDMAIRLY